MKMQPDRTMIFLLILMPMIHHIHGQELPVPPSRIQFSDIMPTSLRIAWNPSPLNISYVIQYGPTDFDNPDEYLPEISDIVTTSFTVRDLTPRTIYVFFVMAVNEIGRGPRSSSSYVTTSETDCGGEYTTITGIIAHPLYGFYYKKDQDCTWIIRVAVGTINIKFDRFDIGKNRDYLYIRDGDSIESDVIYSFTGRDVPSSFQTSTSTVHLFFREGCCLDGDGFVLHWEQIVSPQTFYQIPIDSDYEIKLNFFAKPQPTTLELSYGKNYQEMPNLIQIPSDNENFSASIVDLDNGKYQARLRIAGITDKDFKKKFNLHVANEIGEGNYRFTLSKFAPPPSSLQISNATNSSVLISWDYNFNPGNISSYVIQYRKRVYSQSRGDNQDNDANQDYNEISGIVNKFHTVIGLIGFTEYEFRVLAANKYGCGPTSEPSYARTLCGGEYNSIRGSITIREHGQRDKEEKDCIWLIRAAHPINIKFDWFKFDSYSNDYLYIRDGDNIESNVLCSYNRDTSSLCAPLSVQTTTNAVHLLFTSGNEQSSFKSGFEIHWEPGVAPIQTFYQIPMHSDYEVRLNFSANPQPTALQWSYGSYYNIRNLPNHIGIPSTDGKLSTSLIDLDNGKYQALLRIAGITEEDLETNFNLHVTNEIGEADYRVKLSMDEKPVGCGGEYNSSSGSIRHPFRACDSQNQQSCTWIIRATEIINITIVSHKFYSSDSLIVRDGASNDSHLLYTFSASAGCLDPTPISFQPTNNAVHLHFTSNVFNNKTIFEIHWEPPVKAFYQIPIHSDYEVRLNFSANPQPASIKWFYGRNFQEMPNVIQIPSDNGKFSTSLIDFENGNYQALLRISDITEEDFKNLLKLHVDSKISETNYKVMLSGCGGEYNSSSGTIRYPIHGGELLNIEECFWIIRAGVGTINITIDWFYTWNDDLYIRDGESNNTEYLRRYGGHYHPLLSDGPQSYWTELLTHTPAANLHFKVNTRSNYEGFMLHWEPAVNIQTFYQVVIDSDYEVRLNFAANPRPTVLEWYFGHNFQEMSKLFQNHSNKEKFATSLIDLENGNYTVLLKIAGITKEDIITKFKLHVANEIGETNYRVALSGRPYGPLGLNYSDIMSTMTRVTWDSTVNAGNISYVLQYKPKHGDHNYTEISDIITNVYTIRGLTPDTRYEFYVLAVNEFGRGPPSKAIIFDTNNCGGDYNSSSGLIRHPFTGEHYETYRECTWIIRAEHPIKLTFMNYDTTDADYLYIRDGDSIDSKELQYFGGGLTPSPVQTSTNAAHLVFTSGHHSTRTKTGLWIHWGPAAPLHHLKEPACSELFTTVGDSCLLLRMGKKLTWAAAREYCQGLEADLVVIKDANHYADILAYIWRINGMNTDIDFWIGGSYETVEGHWVWINGELMAQGPPFWGSLDRFVAEPSGGQFANCAGLDHRDHYYIHDFNCTLKHALICQKISA